MLGVVYDPIRDELFQSARAHPSTCNGSETTVGTSSLSNAVTAVLLNTVHRSRPEVPWLGRHSSCIRRPHSGSRWCRELHPQRPPPIPNQRSDPLPAAPAVDRSHGEPRLGSPLRRHWCAASQRGRPTGSTSRRAATRGEVCTNPSTKPSGTRRTDMRAPMIRSGLHSRAATTSDRPTRGALGEPQAASSCRTCRRRGCRTAHGQTARPDGCVLPPTQRRPPRWNRPGSRRRSPRQSGRRPGWPGRHAALNGPASASGRCAAARGCDCAAS